MSPVGLRVRPTMPFPVFPAQVEGTEKGVGKEDVPTPPPRKELRLRRGRWLHGCRICLLFFRVILSRWSGCKSSTCLWMWLWSHPLPLVSLPRLLIPGIRQLLLMLLRRAASPSHFPVLSPPPWVTVTASPLPPCSGGAAQAPVGSSRGLLTMKKTPFHLSG